MKIPGAAIKKNAIYSTLTKISSCSPETRDLEPEAESKYASYIYTLIALTQYAWTYCARKQMWRRARLNIGVLTQLVVGSSKEVFQVEGLFIVYVELIMHG